MNDRARCFRDEELAELVLSVASGVMGETALIGAFEIADPNTNEMAVASISVHQATVSRFSPDREVSAES
jgi:hypothetical protein